MTPPQRTVVVGVIVPSPESIPVVTVHRRCRVNLAHTVFAVFMVTVQVAPFALSQPPHDLNSYSSDCVIEPVAVMVTTVPAVKLLSQSTAPPPVVQATLPPVPAVAFSEYVVGGGGGGATLRAKPAVSLYVPAVPVAEPTVGVHAPVPLQPFVQLDGLDVQPVK